MNSSRTTLAASLAAILGTAILVGRPAVSLRASAASFPNDEATVTHVLGRIAFGPRPGDVERVQRMGLGAYIDEQLHPERIPNQAMDTRLAGFTTVKLTSGEIADRFERPLLEMRRSVRQQAGGGGDQEAMQARPEVRQAQQQANSVLVELGEQKVLRAVYSDRQLQEVLADFWFNHFNVDARKGRDRFMLTEYEREAIRPHVLGKFRDLLEATAKSPAMLFYLDNWLSVDPNGLHAVGNARAQFPRGRFGRPGRFPAPNLPPARPQQAARPPNAPKGLNENYGRELMELHTLGVDGGYTQKDVTEVARAFTGWTIDPPRQGGAAFRFEPRMHDEGEKQVLGHRIKAGGGMEDAEQVLDILARHPSTARFISTKLARRFVGDTPPPALVDRMAARFRETDGDLREVMRTLLTSPEFVDPKFRGAKVKTPLEFVVSAVRALGVDAADGRQIVGAVQQLGMPLYQCQPPTGYKDTGDAWATSGALVSRMNVALNLGGRPIPGIPAAGEPWSAADHDAFIRATLGTDVSAATREAISKATSTPQVVALTLGSPEFQHH